MLVKKTLYLFAILLSLASFSMQFTTSWKPQPLKVNKYDYINDMPYDERDKEYERLLDYLEEQDISLNQMKANYDEIGKTAYPYYKDLLPRHEHLNMNDETNLNPPAESLTEREFYLKIRWQMMHRRDYPKWKFKRIVGYNGFAFMTLRQRKSFLMCDWNTNNWCAKQYTFAVRGHWKKD